MVQRHLSSDRYVKLAMLPGGSLLGGDNKVYRKIGSE